jgi:hypothetical protein
MPKEQNRPLELLRKSAQRILMLTDGCETLQQAALNLQNKVNAQSTDPSRHRAMLHSLGLMRDKVGNSMFQFIELYANGSEAESHLDEFGFSHDCKSPQK